MGDRPRRSGQVKTPRRILHGRRDRGRDWLHPYSPHGFIDRQKTIGPGVVLDLDDEDNVVGIETIGEVKLSEILFRLLTVAKVPRSIH